MMTYAEQVELLGRVNTLEAAGQHREAIALCESVLDGKEIPEFNLALARNHYAIAVKGNEIHAWPAMLAALDGIAKRTEQQPDVVHAIGICRWVLSFFSDPHRLDARQFFHSYANKNPGDHWWKDADTATPTSTNSPAPDLEEMERLVTSGQHVRGANALLATVPAVIRHGREPESVGREARYLLATLYSALAGEKVGPLLATDEFPPPGDHGGQLYDRYLLSAAEIHREQIRAQVAEIPGIVITSLPKSASEFLSYTLAETLHAPVLRVTIGHPMLATVYAKWVAAIVKGGAVTHDHFAATDVNLAALREGGLTQIWVLVRDPRSAFWSYEKMQMEYDGVSSESRMDRAAVTRAVRMLSNWIASWVRAKEAGFPVKFVFFRQLTESPGNVMGEILTSSGAGRFVPLLHETLQQRAERGKVSSNFRKGDDEAWRAGVPAELHEAIWEVIDPSVKQLLGMKP
ncbi:MAG: hypothetical protein K8U57_03625 [Planctomycetes bacterium]|nr:hypothetical protein [Planctomycetota bacterium]